MTLVSRTVGALIAMLLAALAACDSKPLSGPPTLQTGRDECGECGMLISEERCSCGVLVEVEGRREYVLFDDIGCMLDSERETSGSRSILERYVRDHGDRMWIPTGAAVFLVTDPSNLPTPMGSGMVAFSERTSAEQAQRQHGGQLLDYAGALAAREKWMVERFGRPEGGR